VDFISSGPLPPNPAELLGSQRMVEEIEYFKKRADIVIFDSPPVTAVTDACVLAPYMDGILVVVYINKATRTGARDAKSLLDKVNAKILGVVINGVERRVGYYYHYYRE
jgi:capsular exopolysaccharide synthesis family protein